MKQKHISIFIFPQLYHYFLANFFPPHLLVLWDLEEAHSLFINVLRIQPAVSLRWDNWTQENILNYKKNRAARKRGFLIML